MLHCFLFSIKIYARLYTICLIRGEAVCQQIERTDCPTRLSVRAKKKTASEETVHKYAVHA
jgi:hypothetical protein